MIMHSSYFDDYVVSYMEKAVENTTCPPFSPYWGGTVNDKETRTKEIENMDSEIRVRRLKHRIS